MAELKTRILLRSDLLTSWVSVNPVLGKGELGISFDPTVAEAGRKIKFKIGDGVHTWNELTFVADYDAVIAALQGDVSALDAELDALAARVEAIEGKEAAWDAKADKDYVDEQLALKANAADVYTKNEVYTKGETDAKIAEEIGKIKHWQYKIVDVLPEPSADCANIIFLVPKASSTGYEEFICINEGTEETPVWKFEKIGDTDIDLSEYRKAADQDVIDNAIKADILKKVDKEVAGTNGTAYIFNERDGGGARFVHNDGTESFVGVNDGGENGLVAQIYADKLNTEGKWEGAKLDVTNNGIYYTVGSDSFADRAVDANRLAVKSDVDAKQDKFDVIDGGSAADWS